MKAEIKELPEYTAAYVRKIGPYGKETGEAAFNALADWAGPKGYFQNGKVLSIYWDNPEFTAPEKCRTDACVTVPEETTTDESTEVAIQKIPAGKYAVCSFEISQDEFCTAWQKAFNWLISNGYECLESAHYEHYHNDPKDHPEGKFIVDICIPVK